MKNWRRDLLPGLAMVLVVALIAATDWLAGVERRLYDTAMNMGSHRVSDQVAVVAIDEASLSAIGRWPWSREVHAQLIARLSAAGAKAVGYTVFFAEAHSGPGTAALERIAQRLAGSSLAEHADAAVRADFVALTQLVEEASRELDGDRKLAQSLLKAGSVMLPMNLELGDPGGRALKPLPEFATRSAFATVQLEADGPLLLPLPARGATLPLESLGQAAAGVGFLNLTPDDDGVLRALPLALQYAERSYPGMALLLAARSLDIDLRELRVKLGESVSLGGARIATDAAMRFYPNFHRGDGESAGFQVDSFADVLSGALPAERYRGKLVFVGATAPGLSSNVVTPVSAAMPTVLVVANAASSLLRQDFVTLPKQRLWIEGLVFGLVALYVLLLLPRLGALRAAFGTAVLFALVLGSSLYLLVAQGVWLKLMPAALLLALGHIAVTTVSFLASEEAKRAADDSTAESNRMLGLAFQSQGQLDLAFDKFRQVPLERRMLDPLYNLALDFERKRQFGKAMAVLKHLSEGDANFRDVPDRLARLASLVGQGTEPMVGSGRDGLLRAGAERPRLGRYEIEKELGKGAMGVVYMGRDSKIGRVVAIKTMELSREFDPQELAEVKARFFREAETAGRLSHPNIVTIYDAGEEQELAYIAMEFVKGQDLIPFTRPGHLLPLAKILEMMADIAEALAYAHDNQVIHRDIKPANIMYEAESGLLKVADFGIARISDASRTRTGMVLGTPSYVSPEQLGGRKIDGRADLYALGVTMYQLLCGHLPFEGGSMTELMYKIANDPPANILDYNAALPDAVVRLVCKTLAKRPEDRYQSGSQLGTALRECRAELYADVVDIGLDEAA